jgi:hypothetical protein
MSQIYFDLADPKSLVDTFITQAKVDSAKGGSALHRALLRYKGRMVRNPTWGNPVYTVSLGAVANGASVGTAQITVTVTTAGTPTLSAGGVTKGLEVDGVDTALPHTATSGQVLRAWGTVTHGGTDYKVYSTPVTVS